MRSLSVASLLSVSVMWLALAGLAAIYAWPTIPHTLRGWAIFVAIAPPAYLIGDWVSGKIAAARLPEGSLTLGARLLRVTGAIVVGLALVGVVLTALVMIPKLAA